MYDYSFRLTSDTFSHTPGTCTWDAEIEEYVLVDAFGDAFYGATPRECHDASREASRVRIDHARRSGKQVL